MNEKNYGNLYITHNGLNLIAKWGTGAPRIIDSVWVGSGRLTEGQNPSTLNNLINPVARASSSVPQTVDSQIQFIIEYSNNMGAEFGGPLTTGFYLNEFGIFATDPDLGQILLLYGYLGDNPKFMRPYSDGLKQMLKSPITIGVSGSSKVVLSYPAHAFVTSEEMAVFVNNALVNPGDVTARQLVNRIYEGVDLEVVHSAEIAVAPFNGDVWAWIRARIRAGNYSGINTGDFIRFLVGSVTVIAEVAGLNTYTHSGGAWGSNQRIGNHIDFISRNLWPERRNINLVNYNNGLSESSSRCPWLATDLYAWLNSLAMDVPNDTVLNPGTIRVDYTELGLWSRFPETLRSVIINKIVNISLRYSSTLLLTNDNTWMSRDIGRLWIPSETEINGSLVYGTPGYSIAGFIQYPIFANNMTKRVKTIGNTNTRGYWWLNTPTSGNTTSFCIVEDNGAVSSSLASGGLVNFNVPVCFRIA